EHAAQDAEQAEPSPKPPQRRTWPAPPTSAQSPGKQARQPPSAQRKGPPSGQAPQPPHAFSPSQAHPVPPTGLDARRAAAYRRLGNQQPRCALCGEDDWRCLELHHLAGKAYDTEVTVIVCRNCHRKQSDPAANAAAPAQADTPILERIGRYLLGLGDFFAQLAAKLTAYGKQLLEAARACPWPWGWQAEFGGAA